MSKKIQWGLLLAILLTGGMYIWLNQTQPQINLETVTTPISTPIIFTVRTPEVVEIKNSPLTKSIIAAGDYLVRQQLTNGELAYQVNFLNNDRAYSPSDIRLIGATGSLYTVCRVSGDSKYCNAADLALEQYLEKLVSDPQRFKGTCFYTNGACPLGGAALTIDAIYKRWQATGQMTLQDQNLISPAIELGYFIVSMRKPEGGLYHSFDPHFGGSVDPNYFVANYSSESLLAILQLYEMTENPFWLTQAQEINTFMLTQPVTEDYGHGYAFAMFARLDQLTQANIKYANEIAKVIIAGQVRSLNPDNNSIVTATKIEALSAIAQAFYLSDTEAEWLDREIKTFITFVSARQLPNQNCNFEITDETIQKYNGGVFNSCEDSSIRVDGLQHWVNGLTAFLEYESMIENK